jgi:hypothetical protein
MGVIFKEEGHLYESNDEDKIKWTSVTSFIGMFKPKFDRDAQAKKSSKNKRSKWYGMTTKEIKDAWDGETERAIGLGNWYHNQREENILEFKIRKWSISRAFCIFKFIRFMWSSRFS